MKSSVDIFVADKNDIKPSIEGGFTYNVFSIAPDNGNQVSYLPLSTDTLRSIADRAVSKYVLLQIKPCKINVDIVLIGKWVHKMQEEKKEWGYADYKKITNQKKVKVQTIEYTKGSVRDDFDFGSVIMVEAERLKEYIASSPQKYRYAAWYDFRLWLLRLSCPYHFSESASSFIEADTRKSGEKQFDYVVDSEREKQTEMESAATNHLDKIGALLKPPFDTIDLSDVFLADAADKKSRYKDSQRVIASVIIPVKNRARTIADAVRSALSQKTDFSFNVIVVDNMSDDGTSDIIRSFTDSRIVHLLVDKAGLEIGGCWNLAVNHDLCGSFSVQLDSDDIYSNENTLQKIIDKFYEGSYAMVIGSYQMVNFNLEEIPPGVIDHKEWSDNNGPNNALRINGFGAPRAYHTQTLRKIGFPNVSYGEDYAVALAISRKNKIGRIYEPIYLCRRWNGNSDSDLKIDKINEHNRYKDSIRSIEIEQRQELNSNR